MVLSKLLTIRLSSIRGTQGKYVHVEVLQPCQLPPMSESTNEWFNPSRFRHAKTSSIFHSLINLTYYLEIYSSDIAPCNFSAPIILTKHDKQFVGRQTRCSGTELSAAEFAGLPSNVLPCFSLRFIWSEGGTTTRFTSVEAEVVPSFTMHLYMMLYCQRI